MLVALPPDSQSQQGDIMINIKRGQAGFTLVEIAIVLVIIGLLLGGVLKGQTMVANAKVKALAGNFNGVTTMLNGYQDKFRAIPGDDPAAVAHGNTTQATAATAGNGVIDTGTWVGVAAIVATNESAVFWEHVRIAGLASGLSTSGVATNATGGALGITSNPLHVTRPAGVAGTYTTCAGGVDGTLAQQLDIALDDGVGTTGSMFGAVDSGTPLVAATAVAAYAAGSLYSVCYAF
jgi:prepilin-type N-terminal cleavage/methylation domain-containing protein